MLRQTTLINASLVSSAARRPHVKRRPTSLTNLDARFGAVNERRRFVFGYNAHGAVDAGSGLGPALIPTAANVQEIAVPPHGFGLPGPESALRTAKHPASRAKPLRPTSNHSALAHAPRKSLRLKEREFWPMRLRPCKEPGSPAR